MKRILICSLLALIFISVHSQIKWSSYNHKNGFVIQLPDFFSTGSLVAGGTLQWFNNTVDQNIELAIETFGKGNSTELHKSFQSEQGNFTTVTYKVSKHTWFVISGETDIGILYVKGIIRNGVQHFIRITYPASQKALMDGLLPKISSSFKPSP